MIEKTGKGERSLEISRSPPHFSVENRGSERLSDLSKVTQQLADSELQPRSVTPNPSGGGRGTHKTFQVKCSRFFQKINCKKTKGMEGESVKT